MDSKLELKYKSQEFRNKNGLGMKDPLVFKAILNKLNILTVFKPLTDDISGMVGQLKELKFMLINSNHPLGRQNFTIAHELYHLYYDKNFSNTIVDYTNNNTGDEKKANIFASCLILPDGLIDLIPNKEKSKNKITIPTLIKIEQYYQCSRSALLIRLQNMNIVNKEYTSNLKSNVINQAKLLGYDISLYNKGNDNIIIGDYLSIAKNLYDNDIISESNYIDYLIDIGVNPEEIDLNAYSK
ncbi:MAG: ImmA/IrrE family metallo-endopeptidase [Spirochaetes bacterium]|nr:ImmA/IrrE family metallo-endopeptidase [Spirochaetota bacterium]